MAGDSKTGSPQPLEPPSLNDSWLLTSTGVSDAMFAINATTLYAKAVEEENDTSVSMFARLLKRMAFTPEAKMGAPTKTCIVVARTHKAAVA